MGEIYTYDLMSGLFIHLFISFKVMGFNLTRAYYREREGGREGGREGRWPARRWPTCLGPKV